MQNVCILTKTFATITSSGFSYNAL
uniref:Uncharacterized protein n=1 Tax=Anguilla anguilla TaxID=7936 RepID=A0A0E9PDH5_ANGAN